MVNGENQAPYQHLRADSSPIDSSALDLPSEVTPNLGAVRQYHHQGVTRGLAALKEANQILLGRETHCPAISAVRISVLYCTLRYAIYR